MIDQLAKIADAGTRETAKTITVRWRSHEDIARNVSEVLHRATKGMLY